MRMFEIGQKVQKIKDPTFKGTILEKIELTPRYAVKVGDKIHLIDAFELIKDMDDFPPVSVAT